MHETQQRLIDCFTGNKAHSTSELVELVYPQESQLIRTRLTSADPARKRQAKREKAGLHRKLLYHIDKLIDRGLLNVHHLQERGEKVYVLGMRAGQLTISDRKGAVTITKHPQAENYISQELEAGTVHALTDSLAKVEAFALNAQPYPGIHHLLADIERALPHIEDTLGIIGFENFLAQDEQAMRDALEQLSIKSQDYRVAITLDIDITQKRLEEHDLGFFTALANQRPKRIYVVIATDEQAMQAQHAQLSKVVDVLAARNIKLNFRRGKQAALMGRAGMYRITKQQQALLAAEKGAIISPASYAIDLARTDLPAEELRKLAERIATTLLARCALQRRESRYVLAGLAEITPLNKQLTTMTPYIRFWNYSLEEDSMYFALLSSIRERIKQLSAFESTIFAACGVPLQFEPQLSSTFPHYGQLSERKYTKTPVLSRKGWNKQQLKQREQLLSHYAIDRVRIFREGKVDGAELLTEAASVLGRYDLPFITVDFHELQQTLSLKQFI